ncbi:helix-turn-helix transcriptional regulator [Streptomyces violascens]|uniref:helix-turn-helix transcriptional regulator n=1 Tax=Streptomyces violascens TaxID=67381 RepID=UPI0036B41ECF
MAAPVDRHGEVHTVVQAARRASAGHGSVVLVTGEAGIGKTTLVRALVPQLAALGLLVCMGAADVLECHLPFSAIGDCLDLRRRSPDPRRAAVAAQIHGEPGSWSGPAGADEAALAEGVIGLLEDLCQQSPVALVLDDMQWADSQSLLCLQRINRLVEQLPLLLVLAVRTGQSTPDLDHLMARLAQRGATTIALRPLGEDGVSQLLTRLTGAVPGTVLRRLAADAAGNPFYITALVDALAAGQQLHITGGTAEAGQEAGPGSLHAVIMRRLEFLPAQVIETLRAAALLGSRFSADELAAATGVSPLQLCPLLERAEQAGVLAPTAEHLAFRHDLVRQALQRTLTVSAQQAMHQQLGLGLAAAGHPVERVADQLRRGGGTLGQAGVEWLVTAADQLTARDRDTAVELLERALPAADPADPRVQRLWTVLAGALLAQGQTHRCLQVATHALATVQDPELRTQLRWVLVHRAQAEGGAVPSLHAAQEAVAHPDTSPAQRLLLRTHVALELAEVGEFEQARQTAEDVRTAAKDRGDTAAHAQALTALALLAADAKRPREVLDLAGQAPQCPGGNRTLDTFRATALLDLGRLSEARAVFGQHHGPGAAPDSTIAMLFDHVYSAYVNFIGGLWDDANAEITASRDLPDYADTRRALSGLGALIALHRADTLAAEAYLADAPVRSPYTLDDRFTGTFPRWAHALYEHYCARPAQALDQFDYLCRHDCRDMHALWLAIMAPEVARLALETGNPDRARAMQAFLLDQAEHAEPGVLHPGLLHCQGLVDDRADALLAAADACRALHRPWYEARCHEDAGVLLARRGHRDDARHELHVAAAGYQKLDAAWDLTRVDATARTLGVRRGVRGSRRRPSHGWDSLTSTELKVAGLVVEGLSNPRIADRLFISRRTVQTHVSNILAKLNITSRVEIATYAIQHAAR